MREQVDRDRVYGHPQQRAARRYDLAHNVDQVKTILDHSAVRNPARERAGGVSSPGGLLRGVARRGGGLSTAAGCRPPTQIDNELKKGERWQRHGHLDEACRSVVKVSPVIQHRMRNTIHCAAPSPVLVRLWRVMLTRWHFMLISRGALLP